MKADIREPELKPSFAEPFQSEMENDLTAFFEILKNEIESIEIDDPEEFIRRVTELF